MNWLLGYKVLRDLNGELWSCILEKKGLCYPVGKVIVPRYGDGPITIFESLEAAHNFLGSLANYTNGCVIYQCKYKLYPKKWLQQFSKFLSSPLWRIEKVSRPNFPPRYYKYIRHDLPDGTQLARATKLLNMLQLR
ncbi:MAG: hypothetical protein ACTSQI_07790 [Candidatus Helarchaeota archaeon]